MKIFQQPAIQDQYSPDVFRTGDVAGKRSAGVHLSGVIKHLGRQHGILKEEEGMTGVVVSLARLMYWHMGFAWEHWCVRHYPQIIHQPGELFLDGIFMSPDGVEQTDRDIVLHEFKFTTTSSSHSIQSRMLWLWQVMGYLAGLSAKFGEKCLRAVIHPLYVNGDYRENRHPQYIPVMLEFTWEEIAANWELMVANRGSAVAESGETVYE